MKESRLLTKLVIYILSSAGVIFLVALMNNFYFSQKAIMYKEGEIVKHLSHGTANKIEAVLSSVEKISGTLAVFVQDGFYDQNQLSKLIYSIVEITPEIIGLTVAFEPYVFEYNSYYFALYRHRKNEKVKSTGLGDNSSSYFNQSWYKNPKKLGLPFWSEPYYDNQGDNIIKSTFSIPFYQESKSNINCRGVVNAKISLMRLISMVSTVKICRTGYAFLISQKGLFVNHPDKKLIMKESIFSVAEARNDLHLQRIGREMVKGGTGMVPITDFFSRKKSWMYYAPLSNVGWSVGVIVPEEELLEGVSDLNRNFLIICLVGLCSLGVVAILIAESIASPLRILAKQTASIAQGDFTATVPEAGPRELAQLSHSFNDMGQKLTEYIKKRDFVRDTFGRYVTQEVVKRLLESHENLDMGGKSHEVSIIMADLRGFSPLTAHMAPEQVIILLNRYLGKMIEVLLDYRAIIDNIMGDGILAFFGGLEEMEDHPVKAMACALQMQAAMDEINSLNVRDGFPYLEMGIAVNTDTVVVGNIGSEKRSKFSIVGGPVNLTGRMESYTLGGQVLIGPNTYKRVKGLVELKDHIQVHFKGIPYLASLYDIRGINGPYNIRLRDRLDNLVKLRENINVLISRIINKTVVPPKGSAWISHLSENAAIIYCDEKLGRWENVQLTLLDAQAKQIDGKIYGKVISIKPVDNANCAEVTIHFTSVSPEIRQVIRRGSESFIEMDEATKIRAAASGA
jgi:class 3 adenylate cyclase/HAMP domain-containing protein